MCWTSVARTSCSCPVSLCGVLHGATKARLIYAVGQGEVWGKLFTPSQCLSRISAESLSNAKARVASASDWNRILGRSARRERKHSRKE
jgi:hypothetical protein